MARRSVLPVSTWALRAVTAAGPVLALELGRVADHRPGLPWLLGVIVLSLAWAVRPDAWFGTLACTVVVAWWVQAVRADLPLAAVLAAAALLAAHVAALLADLGPPRMRLDPGVLACWLVRGLGALGAAGALWLLATAVDGTRAPGLWVLALLAGTAAAVGVATVLAHSGQDG